jgi:hypothetical protein
MNKFWNEIVDVIEDAFHSVAWFFRKVHYVFYMLPKIWNNYWFDYSTLDALIIHDTKYRINKYRTSAHCEGAEEHADEMQKFVDMYERSISNERDDELMEKYNAEALFKKAWDRKFREKTPKKEQALLNKFIKEHNALEETKRQERIEAFKYYAENSEKWWD